MRRPSPEKKIDVAILGGGPAGMSTAIWCSELGLSTLVCESTIQLGGQLLQINNPIENYLGREAANGRDLLEHFLETFNKRDVLLELNAAVRSLDTTRLSLTFESGAVMSVSSIVVATGVRRRKLNIPGEDDFIGAGLLSSGAGERALATGKNVVIVGGGDAAVENALILSEQAARVFVAHRRIAPTARPEFIGAARQKNNIRFMASVEVEAINGGKRVENVSLRDVITGEKFSLQTDFVLLRIGVEPNSELLQGKAELDENGYVVVNAQCETSVRGIYAVGDVANPIAPTISSAAGMGATAAKAAFERIRRDAGSNEQT